MAIHRLTPRQIDAVQKNGRLNDGGGLTLEVRMGRTGWRRYWIFRQTVDGRSLSKGLGSYPKTSLKEARKLAGELREKVEETGVIEDVPDQTFLSFARCWMVDNQREHWEPMFRNHAGNILDKALADIKIQHILGILRPVWQSKPTVAKKLRQRLNRVFSAANTLGLMRGNPARWEDGLKNLLPVQDHTSEPFVLLLRHDFCGFAVVVPEMVIDTPQPLVAVLIFHQPDIDRVGLALVAQVGLDPEFFASNSGHLVPTNALELWSS